MHRYLHCVFDFIFDFVFNIVFHFIFDQNSRLPSVYVQADDWGLIHVAEMNLSVRISWSNWWQLACWSVDDFIILSSSLTQLSSNDSASVGPNGGSFWRGPLSQIRVLIEGARKSYQRPLKRRISPQQTASNYQQPFSPVFALELNASRLVSPLSKQQ